jgi:hypothetical protein
MCHANQNHSGSEEQRPLALPCRATRWTAGSDPDREVVEVDAKPERGVGLDELDDGSLELPAVSVPLAVGGSGRITLVSAGNSMVQLARRPRPN